MGLSAPIADRLAALCAERRIAGRCLTLGRQDVELDEPGLTNLLIRQGFMARGADQRLQAPPATLARINRVIASGRAVAATTKFGRPQLISDRLFFAGLGFDELDSVDFDKGDDPTHVFDLNRTGLAEMLGRTYPLVYDGGTLEHVFNVPNALRNIVEVTETGGYIVHLSPANNYLDHGFFQFSPTFFHDYYTANGFEIVAITLYRHTTRPMDDPWTAQAYTPGSLESVSFGGLDGGLYAVLAIVRKTAGATWDRTPTQSRYCAKSAAAA